VTYGLSCDYENQLTQTTYTNGTPTSSFLYNGDNLRVRKTDSQGTTNMLYDGTSLICETNTSGGIVAWYTPGVGFRRAGVPYAYRENGIGSTIQVTNNLGVVVNGYEYDSYGVTYTLQQAMTNPHKFAGKHGYYSDGDSGMQLLGHRYYLPSLGRFLTQDPLGHEAGLNLYQYADQNPLVNLDPDGEQGEAVLTGGLALSGAGAGSPAAGTAMGSNPIGWGVAGIAAATAGAYYASNYLASRYYDVSNVSSPGRGSGFGVKGAVHTGKRHGGDWGELPMANIQAKAVMAYWPLNRAHLLN
jgi:RHS repeat-associated protein